MGSSIKNKKAKLPRKRKKQAIKQQGRKWYRDTILLYNITVADGVCEEPVCKFWVNNSIVNKVKVLPDGTPLLFHYPTKFW